ncbi:MAG TPA: TonB-dependent siderophore receptor [Pseudomonas sp.]|uniref:TonB-dependent receptor n=1 Tax=Pseudomonas sp. TaxID=306 RepID=UPI002BB1853E|nr:TonB-dependent siderophore receptor [Pseudomonas sp.]HRL93665.1 TonB-dependent siderophore receptor [Pseudomonas sp.]
MRSNSSSLGLPQRRLLVSAIGLALASSGALVVAAEAQSQALQLDGLTVDGKQDRTYKVDKAASPKYTAPLLDTPQTITVIPEKMLEEQNALSLRQVLSNVSGITFAAGEGGGGLGDSINIRGFSANNSILIDGLRDSAQTSRTDTFNLEQVEVVKGPNSVYSGAGSTGGTINLVSKEARLDSFTKLGGGLGTDGYQRLTVDTNQQLDGIDGAAFRLNLMAHENDVAGRDEINYERWGIAPTVSFGLGSDTRLSLSYLHQTDDNLPDYGLPALNGKVLAGVDSDKYYGFRNLDTEETDLDSFTVKFEHDLNDQVSLANIARYSETQRKTVVTAAHVNTKTYDSNGAAPGGVLPVPAGKFVYGGPAAYGRDYTTKLAINQTNLTWHFNTGFIEHTLVTGAEISQEKYDRTTFSYNTLAANQLFDLYNPPGYYGGPTNKQDSARAKSQLDDRAVYAFDTLKLSEQWDLNLGLRHERYEGEGKSATIANGVQAPYTKLESSDDMLSSRVGLVYKPADNGSVYVAWGNSFNPSAESLVGNGAGLNADNQDLEPEENETYELGTKWELLDRRLSVNAAIFRVDKTNGRLDIDPGTTFNYTLDGKQRVEGIELGVSGKVTDNWEAFANYTQMRSEIIKAAPSDFAQEGQALANTPPRSFSLWNTYDLSQGWELGYGAQYVDERNVASTGTAKIPAYWLHSAMASYQVNSELNLQLNVYNLFDEEYYDRVRTSVGASDRSSSLVPGDARSAVLSASYSF